MILFSHQLKIIILRKFCKNAEIKSLTKDDLENFSGDDAAEEDFEYFTYSFKGSLWPNKCFFSAENKLYNCQSGFRANHSTNRCLSFLTDKILKRFDEGLLTGIILIDLQKVFDTIDHEILLQKLKAIRFSKGTIRWFV